MLGTPVTSSMTLSRSIAISEPLYTNLQNVGNYALHLDVVRIKGD